MATSQKGERVGGLRGMRGMGVLRRGRVSKLFSHTPQPIASFPCRLTMARANAMVLQGDTMTSPKL